MPGPNWQDKTIWTADNLGVMRGMNSESVDLIYLDPPFNSKTNYAAPIGSKAAGAAFKDTWTLDDVDVEWINLIGQKHPELYRVLLAAMTNSDKSYLAYMAVRILEMRRILKPTGAIYLHCDSTMSHYLKLVLDAIFGRQNFRNEIVWCYPPGGRAPKYGFHKKHDIILYYSKGTEPTFYHQYTPLDEKARAKFTKVDENGRRYKEYRGRRTYLDEVPGRPVPSWWTDIHSLGQTLSAEAVGYPTQKPLPLLERIIKASSEKAREDSNGGGGQIGFDPFFGCATTLVAADRLPRQWAGVDISPKAAELVVKRIKDQQGLFKEIIPRTDIPERTDLGRLPRHNSAGNRQRLYGEQGGHCAGCGTHFETQHLEVDHIIARSKGGTDHIGNLQLLCGNCNRIKGNRGMEYLMAELQLQPQRGFQI